MIGYRRFREKRVVERTVANLAEVDPTKPTSREMQLIRALARAMCDECEEAQRASITYDEPGR